MSSKRKIIEVNWNNFKLISIRLSNILHASSISTSFSILQQLNFSGKQKTQVMNLHAWYRVDTRTFLSRPKHGMAIIANSNNKKVWRRVFPIKWRNTSTRNEKIEFLLIGQYKYSKNIELSVRFERKGVGETFLQLNRLINLAPKWKKRQAQRSWEFNNESFFYLEIATKVFYYQKLKIEVEKLKNTRRLDKQEILLK